MRNGWFAAAVWLFFALIPARAASVLSGKVLDENDAPVNGARVTAGPAAPAAGAPVQATTDPTGSFRIVLPGPGDYVVSVQREGFYELKNRKITVSGDHPITLVLNPVREVFQTLNVTESPSPIDLDQSEREERLSGTEINDVPYPSSHSLRNSMRLMPGVLQDGTGALHFAGSSEYQMLYLLNGFDIGDPITGRLHTRLGVEGIRSVDFWTGRYSPEYGKGSTGALSIRTENGADQFRYTATNFIPGFDTQQGLHLGGWTPRVGVSGPIKRGRAWFADNFDYEFDYAVINGLPHDQNTRSGWAASNLFHTQINVSPSNIVFTDFLVNYENQARTGLAPLDPLSTTTDQRNREYFWGIRDQFYLGRGGLLEFGVGQNRFTFRRVPQGTEPYVLSTEGRTGNYFVDSIQQVRRDQLFANGYLPSFRAYGSHQIKAGVGLDRLDYTADFRRTSYLTLGLAGEVLARTAFEGSGDFRRPNLEQSSYVLDEWRPREDLQVELGVRQDWDELVRRVAISPRLSASWSPFRSGGTKITGGFALTYDRSNLAIFAQPLDQRPVITTYSDAGSELAKANVTFTIPYGKLEVPRYTNWTAGIDHQFPRGLFANVNFLRRRGGNGFTYLNILDPNAPPGLPLGNIPTYSSGDAAFVLTNRRRDRYDSVELSVRQKLAGQYEWMASYTRSRAESNAVLDLNVDQVLQVLDNYGPMPWDAPNRFLGWAYLPLPRRNWAIAILADARTGFPYSIVNERQQVMGEVNSQRYPFNFDLNVHIERTFRFRGYKFAGRVGVNNITDTRNPTAVNAVIGSPHFMTFYGSEGRHLQLRIRFFGRG